MIRNDDSGRLVDIHKLWRCSAMHSVKNKKDGGSSGQNRAEKGW
ncbi:MAG: hypothetical protein Q3M30_18885 [Candidatus Electrothrix sp. Rat3]|nr:hypothetical protein [Candidatus Electrothrix rattekaaiensis]